MMTMALWPRRRKRRGFLKWGILLFFLLILIPWGISLLFQDEGDIKIKGDTARVRVLNHQTNKLMYLGLEEYLVGVVAAEMPASFPEEALKAQAVAARTYAVKRLQVPDPRIKNLNQDADLSTNPALNQAWISSEEMKNRWGVWGYRAYKKKIVRAVQETVGQVLVYQGQLIDPVYHSSCGGGRTENSEDVWKFQIPYLRSVACVDHQDRYRETVNTIDLARLDKALGTSLQSIPVSKLQTGKNYIQVMEKTGTGRVKTMRFGNTIISGTELRSKLGLASTWFDWQVKGESILFITRGNGHGVGMCQYGAAALAEQGKDYRQILTHYYTGVGFARISW
jgi:stage II sporulation protein D